MYSHSELQHNIISPKEIIPFLVSIFAPKSVLDVGCGIGTWLYVFKQNGIENILGIDGEYVNKDLLYKYIAPEEFKGIDLSKPFDLQDKFDIVISLEVAEHLPLSCAELFIDSLCKHSDTIIFSAAVPSQDGQHHLNEQWPSYWGKLFEKQGYTCYDLIRPKIWNNPKVDVWYKQNMFVYSKQKLAAEPSIILDCIHPDYWVHRNNKIASADKLLKRIKEGKVGLAFYIKAIFKSLFFLGRKVDE
jgi:SAM-dependent methyltransferase